MAEKPKDSSDTKHLGGARPKTTRSSPSTSSTHPTLSRSLTRSATAVRFSSSPFLRGSPYPCSSQGTDTSTSQRRSRSITSSRPAYAGAFAMRPLSSSRELDAVADADEEDPPSHFTTEDSSTIKNVSSESGDKTPPFDTDALTNSKTSTPLAGSDAASPPSDSLKQEPDSGLSGMDMSSGRQPPGSLADVFSTLRSASSISSSAVPDTPPDEARDIDQSTNLERSPTGSLPSLYLDGSHSSSEERSYVDVEIVGTGRPIKKSVTIKVSKSKGADLSQSSGDSEIISGSPPAPGVVQEIPAEIEDSLRRDIPLFIRQELRHHRSRSLSGGEMTAAIIGDTDATLRNQSTTAPDSSGFYGDADETDAGAVGGRDLRAPNSRNGSRRHAVPDYGQVPVQTVPPLRSHSSQADGFVAWSQDSYRSRDSNPRFARWYWRMHNRGQRRSQHQRRTPSSRSPTFNFPDFRYPPPGQAQCPQNCDCRSGGFSRLVNKMRICQSGPSRESFWITGAAIFSLAACLIVAMIILSQTGGGGVDGASIISKFGPKNNAILFRFKRSRPGDYAPIMFGKETNTESGSASTETMLRYL